MSKIGADVGIVPLAKLYSGNKNKLFRIPKFQRPYSWEEKHRQDLWEDIREGMVNETDHYLGTVILQETEKEKTDEVQNFYKEFEVVDGQQRLTCLSLLIMALCNKLNNENIANDLWENFLKVEGKIYRIKLGQTNKEYFKRVVDNLNYNKTIPKANSITNKRIEETYEDFINKISALYEKSETPDEELNKMARYIKNNLKLLEFITEDKTLAIKTFQTVNDRGKDLTLLDKAKSFLMFYLTKYNNGEDSDILLSNIEDDFGKIFSAYDITKDIAKKYDISYITQKQQKFSEDNFLQYFYHYFKKYAQDKYNIMSDYEYGISASNVFQEFIKDSCDNLRKNPERLREFIKEVVENLTKVSQSLKNIMEKINEDKEVNYLMRWQQPNALVYPLLISCQAEGYLDKEMINLITVLDMRVYKIRPTDPRSYLYRNVISKVKTAENKKYIKKGIVKFIKRWGDDSDLYPELKGSIYSRGARGEKLALWEYSKKYQEKNDINSYELYNSLEIDHILATEASKKLDLYSSDFLNGEEEFKSHKDRLGNLTVLEKNLNNKAKNQPPLRKANKWYQYSRNNPEKTSIRANQILAEKIKNNGNFTKSDIENRTEDIAKSILEKWEIPEF